MPIKDKARYNEYMKNYMKNKNAHKVVETPTDENDFDATKPTIDISKTADLIKETKNLLGNGKSDPEAESDPILKAIDKYGKYIPIVMKFFEGFAAQAKANEAQQVQQENTIKAPEGWTSASGFEKLNRKYRDPAWYAAGEAYDNYISTGQFNPSINTSYVDANYSPPQSRRTVPLQDNSPVPSNFNQLSKKYPEPPLVNDAKPIDNNLNSTTSSVQHGEGNNKNLQQINENRSSDVESIETPSKEKALIAELQADNAKYLKMGIDYLNKMSETDFKKGLNDIDKLVEKWKPFIPLIPIQVKGMIAQSPTEELEDIFKNGCPKKYDILKKSKKLSQVRKLIEELRKLLN